MKKKPKNPNAFPITLKDNNNPFNSDAKGMSLRDYFAAKAMQGLMTMEDKGTHKSMEDCYAKIAELSYGCADAMLKQREL